MKPTRIATRTGRAAVQYAECDRRPSLDRPRLPEAIGFLQRASCRTALPFPDAACRRLASARDSQCRRRGHRADEAVPVDVGGGIVESVQQRLGERAMLQLRRLVRHFGAGRGR